MNLRHIPSRKASKRGYQILFVLALVVLSGLFSTCSGCDSPAEPETLEFNYPEIKGTVNSPLGNIEPEWTGTPEAGTTYAADPDLPKGLSLASDTGIISGTPEAIMDTGKYTITATFPNGGTRSVEISLTIGKSPDTLPAAPANVRAVPGDGEITVTWEDPADTGIFGGEKAPITGFKIYYSENQIDTAQDTPIDFTDLTQDRSVTIPGLTNETSYNIAVSTVTGAGEGELSAAVTAVPKALSGGPTELSIVSYGETEIELTWKEPADSITKYRVYYSKTPNIDTTTADFAETQDGSTAALSVTSLDSGTPYYFKVTAFSDAGESAASSEVEAYTNGVPGEPSNIKAATTGAGEITVTWDESSPGYYEGSAASVSYKVYHKTDSLAEADLPSLTPEDVNTGLMHVLTNLQADSTYFVTVVAYNDIGDSTVPPSVEATALGADRAPGAPTSVTITSSTETGIELSWMPPTDMGIINGDGTPGTIIGYTVYYSKTTGFAIGDTGVTPQTTGNTNSISLTSLDSGTQYYFRVLAANETGPGAASAEVDGYTTSRPGAPTIAAADPGTTADSEVTLSWDAPVDKGIKDSTGAADTITEYKVYYADSSITDLSDTGLASETSTGTSKTITGLSAGTRYYFKVAALNGTGEGDSSVEADTYTNGVPDAPSNIQAATTAAGEITVTWDEPSPGYYGGSEASLSYKVYHKTDSLDETDLPGLTPATVDTGLRHVLTNLQAGSTYFITVIASNTIGSSAMPTSVEAAPFGADRPPGAPTSVTIDSSMETGITLSWTAPGDMGIINGDGTPGTIKGYEVYYSKTPNFTIGDTGVNSQTATTTSFSFTSLDSGTQYYFKVTAANDSGSGNASSEATGYTLSRPGAPTDLAADPGTAADNEVTLTWNAPAYKGIEDSGGTEGTLSYRVYYAESTITDLNGGGVTGVDAQGTPHKITGLTPGTRYYFKAAAANGIGEETASVEADTYTNSLPGEPTNIQATPSVDSLTVSWTAPSAGYSGGNPGTLSYKLYHSTADITSVTDLTTLTETEVTSGTAVTLDSLTGGTTYYLIVIANNGYGDSPRPASISAAAWEADSVPGMPTSVTIDSSTETGITLSWTAPNDTGIVSGSPGTIVGYTVYYSKTAGFAIGDTGVTPQTTGNTNSISFTSLDSGTQYYFRVLATNAKGSGNPSAATAGYTTSKAGAPTDLAADPGTAADSEVTLTWNAPAYKGITDSSGTPGTITGYRVYYAASSFSDLGAAIRLDQPSTGRTETITGLTPGTQYYFRVTADNGTGEGAASSEANTYTNSLPGAPTNIQVSKSGAGELTITWDESSSGYYNGSESPVSSYRVYYQTGDFDEADLSGLTPKTVTAGSERKQVLTGLQGGSIYFVTVIAVNDFGSSAMPTSVEAAAFEANRPPGAPTSVTITSSTETGIVLSWTAPGDMGIINGDGTPGSIIGYEVYYSKTANFTIGATGVTSQSSDTNSISLTSLDSGTQYYFKVSAANEDGSGVASAEVDGYTTSRPGAPTNAVADPGTTVDSEVTLSWDTPVDKGIKDSTGAADTITEYKVYYADSSITDLSDTGLASETSAGTSKTITGLSAGTRYYFKVVALNGTGEGDSSVEADTYTNGVPDAPSNIQAATTAAGEITVTWDEPSPGYYGGSEASVSYKVYHKTDSLDETDLPGLTPATVDTGLSHVLTNLQAGSTYFITVVAYNDIGDSTVPASVEATALGADRAPGAPTSVTIDSSTETGITLSWTAPTDTGLINSDGTPGTITAYSIYYSETQNFTIDGNTAKKEVDNTTPTTTASIDNLNSKTQYYFKVTAANDSGSGNASSEATGYTLGRPGVPTDLAADPGTAADNEVTLTWDAPVDKGIEDSAGTEGTLSYRVYYAESTITDLNGGGVTGVDAQGTPHKITGLNAGTPYYFKVTAVNGIGEGTASVEADTYTNSLPGEPTSIQAAPSVDSLTVSWTAPSAGYSGGNPGTLSYKLYHSTADITSGTDLTALSKTEVTSGTTATLSSLTGGTTYYLIVIANNGYGDSPRPASISAAAWEADSVPGLPTSVTITSSTENGIVLSWMAPNDTGIESGVAGTIVGYTVYYSKTAGFAIGDTGVKSQTTGTTSFSFTSLDSGTQYYFRVLATNAEGSGNPSAEKAGYTTSKAGAPTNLAADPGTTADNEVTLTWDAPVDKGIEDSAGTVGTLSYRVYYAESTITDLNGGGVTGVDAQGTPHKITGLTPGTRYYFKVAAVNGIGEGTASSEADTYTNSLPGEPTDIQAAQGVDSLTVSWTAPSAGYSGGNPGTLSYKLYHSTADITSVTDLTALTKTEVTSGTAVTLDSLTGGTTYYLIVIANNGYGDSPRPASISAAAWEASNVPGVPTSVTITSSTENEIVLSWMAPNDTGIVSGSPGTIIGYTVYYSKTAGFAIGDTGVTPQTTGNTNSFSFTSLDSGTQYYFRVLATNETGSGNLSAATAGYTTSKAGAPTNVAADPGTAADNEVTLTWDAPAYKGITDSSGTPGTITGYRVYYATSSFSDLVGAIRLDQPSTGRTETITGLTPGTQYYFRVTADNGTGEGAASSEADTYTNSLPSTPTNIQVSKSGAGELTITWDESSSGYYNGSESPVSSYRVYYQTGNFDKADLPGLTPKTVDAGSERKQVLTGLQGGSIYYIAVIAVNDFGGSVMPATLLATPSQANRAPGNPASVTIVSSTETEITLSWKAPVDTGIINGDGTTGTITGYTIYYSENPAFIIDEQTAKSEVGKTTTTATIGSLNPGTLYIFQVTAENEASMGEPTFKKNAYTTSPPDAPTNVAAVPVTTADTEVTLTWNAPVDRGIKDSAGAPGSITAYKVYYATSAINDVNAATEWSQAPTGTSETITGLNSGTQYYFKVAAVNSIGEGATSSEADTYTNSLPGEPTSIQAASTEAGKITVTWEAPSSGYYNGSEASLSYKVYYKADSLADTDLPSLTPEAVNTGLSTVLTGLPGGSTYYVTVIAVNAFGDSAMPTSVETTIVEADRPPGAPTFVNIDSSTETEIALSWRPPDDIGIVSGSAGTIMGYEVYYSKTANFAINEGVKSPSITSNSISLTSLDSGTQYYFKVTAANEDGSGAASAEIDGYTTSRPGAPTNAAANPGTTADSEVTLSWDAPGDPGIKDSGGAADTISGYRVYHAASPITDLGVLTGVDAQGTSHKITGLNAGTRYYFKVAALNSIGEGSASVEADTYTNGVPGEPLNIRAVATTDAGEITVTWDEPSPGYYSGSAATVSYKVYHKTDSLAETDLPGLTPATVTGLSHVLTGLQAGTYYFTVIAVNDFGSSAMPTSVEASAFGNDRPPGAPTSVTIDSSTENGITLSWMAPADTGIEGGSGAKGTIKDYAVYYSKTPNFAIGDTGVNSKTETTTSYSLTSLDSGTQYYFKVTAANATGSGNASAEASGYTTSKPGAPTNVKADPGTTADSEVTLTWDAPVDGGIADSSNTPTPLNYKVYYAESTITDLSGGGVTGVDAQGTPHKITGLTPGTQYYFRVMANNGIGEGTVSLEADTYTNSLPGEPTDIQAVQGVESLTVNWTAPSAGYAKGSTGVLSYKLYHSTADITPDTDLTALTETEVTSGTTAALSSLTGGTTYYLIVIANNGYGDSTRPTAISAVPWEANRPPGAPTSVTIDSSTETGIDLSWTAPNDTGIEGGSGAKGTILGYKIYYSKTADFTIAAGVEPKTTGNTNSISLTSLDSGTRYYFKVSAANSSGSGTASEEADGYTISRPDAPTGVNAYPVVTFKTEIEVTWNAPAVKGIAAADGTAGTLSKYRMYYASSPIIDVNAEGVTGVDTQGTSHKITEGLTSGTRYYFKVTAFNEIGEGAASSEVYTYTDTPPGEPDNVVASSYGLWGDAAMVRWDHPTNSGYYGGQRLDRPVKYRVYWAESTGTIKKDQGNYMDVAGDQTSKDIGGLTPDTEYIFAVEAFTFDTYWPKCRSSLSDVDSFTPFQLVPDAPTNLRSIQADKEGKAIWLKWDAPAYTGRYLDGTEVPLSDIQYKIVIMPTIYPDPNEKPDSLSATAVGATSILLSHAAGTIASDSHFVPGVVYGFEIKPELISSSAEGKGTGSIGGDVWKAPVTLRAGSPAHTDSYIGNEDVSGVRQPSFGSPNGALAISPDGKSLYLVSTTGGGSYQAGTLLVFDRDEDGIITLRKEYRSKTPEGNLDGLRRPRDVLVSPDGKNVYLVGDGNYISGSPDTGATLVVFSRYDDGSLNRTRVFFNGKEGVNGMGNASALAISPDGETIYVAGPEDNALAIFARDTSTGGLTYSGMVQRADDLTEVEDVAVSTDGRNVYAVGPGFLAIFDRDSSGGLAYRSALKQGVSGVEGLENSTDVAVSPDGKNVYVSSDSSTVSDGVTTFTRSADGGLTYDKHLVNDHSIDVDVSPDGQYVYVVTDSFLNVYERDAGDGSLTSDSIFVPQETIDDTDPKQTAVQGSNQGNAVVVSPDNKNIYVFTYAPNIILDKDEDGYDRFANGVVLTFVRFDITY